MSSGSPPTVVTRKHVTSDSPAGSDGAGGQLSALLATIPGIVWESHGLPGSSEDQQIFISDYAENLLGYSVADWTSRPGFWLEVIHPDDRQRVAREFADFYRSRQGGVSEFRCIRKTGESIWVESRSTVLCDTQGNPRGMRGVTMDISRRKELENERADLLARQDQAHREARAAVIRTAVLQRATSLLSEAVSPQQVGAIILNEMMAAFGAQAGTVALLAHDILTVIHQDGKIPSLLSQGKNIALGEPLPLPDAVRSGQAIWVESAQALREAYPSLQHHDQHDQTEDGAWIAIPLMVKNKVIGAMELSFRERRSFQDGDRRFILAICQQGAEALERARLYTAEQQAHRQEEEMRKAWSFLADAGNILASSLDYNLTLERISELAVPIMADWCSVDLCNAGTLRHVAIAHKDPEKLAFARELRRRFPPQPDALHGVAAVMRSGQSELIPHLTDDVLYATFESEEVSLLRKLGLRSCMVVPLIARDRLVGIMTFATGESGRQYAESDLAVAEELAARAALAIDNAGLYAEARQAIKSQNDMLAVVSHDLDNPLTVLDMSTQVLERLLATPEAIPSQMPEILEQMRSSTRMASRLIQDLREVGHIESGFLAISPQVVKASTLFAETMDMFLHLAEQRGIALSCSPIDEGVQVQCDRMRVIQVLANLIGNALKFTPKGQTVTLSYAQQDDKACFCIKDTGPGIPESDLPHLFDKYWKAKKPGVPGSGLGLYIAQELVRAHGGEIWVESAQGQGTAFHFTLPLISD